MVIITGVHVQEASISKNKALGWPSIHFNVSSEICQILGPITYYDIIILGERGGSGVECRTPGREVGGSKPTAAVLCP